VAAWDKVMNLDRFDLAWTRRGLNPRRPTRTSSVVWLVSVPPSHPTRRAMLRRGRKLRQRRSARLTKWPPSSSW